MTAATLTYIDADLAEKQRKVQVVVFYGPQCIYTCITRLNMLYQLLLVCTNSPVVQYTSDWTVYAVTDGLNLILDLHVHHLVIDKNN